MYSIFSNYSFQVLYSIFPRLLNYLSHCLSDETEYDWSLSEEEEDEAPEQEGEPRYCTILLSIYFPLSDSHYGAYDAQKKKPRHDSSH